MVNMPNVGLKLYIGLKLSQHVENLDQHGQARPA